MLALAKMVSTLILVSVLVATLVQHVRQVCFIHDVEMGCSLAKPGAIAKFSK